MTQVYRASMVNTGSYLAYLSEEAQYMYSCILKYKKLRTKGFREQ